MWVRVCVAENGWNQVCLDEKSKHIDKKKTKIGFETLNPLGAKPSQNEEILIQHISNTYAGCIDDYFFLLSVLERSHAEVFLLNVHSFTHACMQKRSYKIS